MGGWYFGVGTATNSGVVGHDNPWAKAMPEFHDIPGKTIVLTGSNFQTHNFLRAPGNATVTTGGYVPYSTPTKPGQVIKGDVKCTGCIRKCKIRWHRCQASGMGLQTSIWISICPRW